METPKLSIGNGGVCVLGFQESEMEDMNNEQNVSIPPVVFEKYSDFRSITEEAAVVVYSPEYYQGPFTDEPKRLRRVIFTALGVQRRGTSIIFKYILDDVRDIDRVVAKIIDELESHSNLVRGSVETSRPMGELLASWP
ncbi:hypothetical protein EU527_19215 [Candidatus Thorarchaeota archaeon]|nr:MAG: hypothetical protein EU527_19215 [Candidatus Thorarchaeota archaeon]